MTLGIVFEGCLKLLFKYAKLDVIEVKHTKRRENIWITANVLVPEVRNSGLKFELLVIGAMNNPASINTAKIINKTIVNMIKVLIANL